MWRHRSSASCHRAPHLSASTASWHRTDRAGFFVFLAQVSDCQQAEWLSDLLCIYGCACAPMHHMRTMACTWRWLILQILQASPRGCDLYLIHRRCMIGQSKRCEKLHGCNVLNYPSALHSAGVSCIRALAHSCALSTRSSTSCASTTKRPQCRKT